MDNDVTMLTKARSAPSTVLQSRLAKNQSEAMKAMQEWARRAEEPGVCHVSRMSGQLTENVTEERMLRAKLWELSKERYKFLMQNAYEKKLFADRMQRKAHAMLKARANSAATVKSRTGNSWTVGLSTLGQLRPFSTSKLSQHGAVSRPTSRVSQAWSSSNTCKNIDRLQPNVPNNDKTRAVSTSKNAEGRPNSTSKNVIGPPISDCKNTMDRSISPSKNIKECLVNTSKNAVEPPVNLSRNIVGNPTSTSRNATRHSVSTPENAEGHLVRERQSLVSTEGSPQNTYTYSDSEHSRLGMDPLQHRSEDVDKALTGDVSVSDYTCRTTDTPDGKNMTNDTVHNKDTSPSEDRNSQMREVERKWVMSGGRGRVTPAATPICIPHPSGVHTDGGGKIVLAPIPDIPPSPVPPQNNSQTNPSPVRITATNPRNVKFSQTCVGKEPEGKRRLSQASGNSHRASKTVTANVPSPGVLPTRPPSGSTVSSKPNSATSRRSKPWSTAKATSISAAILSHRRGLPQPYGMRLESKTSDPRYASLEHSLIPVQPHPPAHTDVSSIVRNFDALHVQPKLRKEVKPKTELKALKYMNERGFVF